MTQGRKVVSARWRALALVLVGVMVGLFLLAPASAHIGTPKHLWKTHIKPKTDARYVQDKIFYRRSAQQSVGVGLFDAVNVSCPPGTLVVGGGMAGSVQGVGLEQSGPTVTGATTTFTGWHINVFNSSSATRTWRAYVICVQADRINADYNSGDTAS